MRLIHLAALACGILRKSLVSVVDHNAENASRLKYFIWGIGVILNWVLIEHESKRTKHLSTAS